MNRQTKQTVITEGIKYFFWNLRHHTPRMPLDKKLDELHEFLRDIREMSNQDKEDSSLDLNYVPKEETFNDIASQEVVEAVDLVKDILVVGGVLVVFGIPGHGKSTLVTQMLIDIALGQDSKIWSGCSCLDSNVKVTLYDAELKQRQIKKRYCKHGFHFPSNMVRIHDSKVLTNGSALIADIKRVVASNSKHQVIAIDNMTKIFVTMSAVEIASFYKQLDKIHESAEKRGQVVTILIVGHTTKADPYSTPELSDLYGSSFLVNFANTVLAFWPSSYGNDTKFVRVLKNRDHEFSDSKVTVMKRIKSPYLQFELVSSSVPLEDALMVKVKGKRAKEDEPETYSKPGPKPKGYSITDNDRTKMFKWVTLDGWSQAKIADELGANEMAVSRAIKSWKKQNLWTDQE